MALLGQLIPDIQCLSEFTEGVRMNLGLGPWMAKDGVMYICTMLSKSSSRVCFPFLGIVVESKIRHPGLPFKCLVEMNLRK
jgi:hypothetical protein